MASRICWHCQQYAHLTQISDPRFADDPAVSEPSIWFACFQCDNCRYYSTGKLIVHEDTKALKDRLNIHSIGSTTSELRTKAVKRLFERADADIEWIPETALGKEYDNVDNDTVKDSASEAYACYSVRAYRAAILMARSVCEAIAKDQGFEEGNLQKKIAQMEDQRLISPMVKQQADEIRYLGNDMAHGDFAQPVSADDAHEVLNFLDVLIDAVYQQPAKLRAMQTAREQRKNRKEVSEEERVPPSDDGTRKIS